MSRLKRFEKRVLKSQKKIAAEQSLASAPRVLRGQVSNALPSESTPAPTPLYVPQHLRPATAVTSTEQDDGNSRKWSAGSRVEDYSVSDPVFTTLNNGNSNYYDASEVYYAPELSADFESASQPGGNGSVNTPRSQRSTFVPQQNKYNSAGATYRPRTFTPSAPNGSIAASPGSSSKVQGLLERKFSARSPAVANRTFSTAH